MSRRRVGIFPIRRNDIVSRHHDEDDLSTASDFDIFHGPKFKNARCEATLEFLDVELRFRKDDIMVGDAVMAKNGYSQILWINVSEEAVKKVCSFL